MSMWLNISETLGSTTTGLNVTSTYLNDAHQNLRAVEVFAVILMSILIVLTFQGNLWIIIAIIAAPQLRNSMANIFVINLCAVDLMASVLAMPFSVATFVNGPDALEKVVCEVSGFFATCLMVASMLSLCVISIERFYCIALPMHHAGHATPCLYLLVILLVWIVSIGVAMLPWLGINSYNYRHPKRTCSFYWQGGNASDRAFIIVVFVISFLVPSLILITMYIGIFRVARKAATSVAPKPTGSKVMPTLHGDVTSSPNHTFHGNARNVFVISGPASIPNRMPAISIQEASPKLRSVCEKITTTAARRTSGDDSGTLEVETSDKISVQSEPMDNGQATANGTGGGHRCKAKTCKDRKHTSSFMCACGEVGVDQDLNVRSYTSTTSARFSDSGPCSAPARINTESFKTTSFHAQMSRSPCPRSLGIPHGKVTSSHMKAFKTLMVIVLSYLLLWGPYFICQLHGLTHQEAASGSVEVLATWLSFACYAVNPCLYGCMNRMIREELNHLLKSAWFCCCFCLCCDTSNDHCKCRRPCQKPSEDESDPELGEDGDGPAESFYQFLQRTQASDVTAPVISGKRNKSSANGVNGITMDGTTSNVSADYQSNCVF